MTSTEQAESAPSADKTLAATNLSHPMRMSRLLLSTSTLNERHDEPP
jgi:hypothetical protein